MNILEKGLDMESHKNVQKRKKMVRFAIFLNNFLKWPFSVNFSILQMMSSG